jgi:hypothetical protein
MWGVLHKKFPYIKSVCVITENEVKTKFILEWSEAISQWRTTD